MKSSIPVCPSKETAPQKVMNPIRTLRISPQESTLPSTSVLRSRLRTVTNRRSCSCLLHRSLGVVSQLYGIVDLARASCIDPWESPQELKGITDLARASYICPWEQSPSFEELHVSDFICVHSLVWRANINILNISVCSCYYSNDLCDYCGVYM